MVLIPPPKNKHPQPLTMNMALSFTNGVLIRRGLGVYCLGEAIVSI